MKYLVEFIKLIAGYREEKEHQLLMEMSDIQRDIRIGNNIYSFALHGQGSKDRNYPHVHIYLTKDHSQTKFNLEISLIDILCNDEINLIRQLDRTKPKKINIKNRERCSWTGYKDIKYEFEDWLEKPYKRIEGIYKNNLDALISEYNFTGSLDDKNPFLAYVQGQGKKILPKYRYLFSENDQRAYKDCF